jgi:hypothetical protein
MRHRMFLLNTHPKISFLQNREARLNFVKWYLYWAHDEGSPCSLPVAMKLGFSYVDTWPLRTMALASLSSHEVPLHDVRLPWGVLREQLALLGSFFSLTPQNHTNILTVFEHWSDNERAYAFFQQDRTTVNTAKISEPCYSVSCDRIIMKWLGPYSSDRNPCDFYWWGMLMDKAYSNYRRKEIKQEKN